MSIKALHDPVMDLRAQAQEGLVLAPAKNPVAEDADQQVTLRVIPQRRTGETGVPDRRSEKWRPQLAPWRPAA
jgi:hypothetical protein